jgi:hypothetical protein
MGGLACAIRQLLSSVDASVAARFVSSQSLAGIGATVPITSMCVNLFVGIPVDARADLPGELAVDGCGHARVIRRYSEA